jgi:hypothetical protein
LEPIILIHHEETHANAWLRRAKKQKERKIILKNHSKIMCPFIKGLVVMMYPNAKLLHQ